MSSGRTIDTLDTYQADDKSFNKHVLTKGIGELTPNEGAVCIVSVTLVGEFDVDESDLGSYKLGTETEVTIGEGDTLLSELIDKVIMSMKEDETSYVNSKVDSKGVRVSEFDLPGKNLKFNVTLRSFSRAADLSELEPDERLERAEAQKERGTQLYQENRIDYSVKRFKRALENLNGIEASGELTDGIASRVKTLKCHCHLNLAAAFLKSGQQGLVIEHSTAALDLDPDNIKGLFRRGQALTTLNHYDEARRDIGAALVLDRDNKAIAAQMRTLDALVNKEKQMYQKMFK